MASSEDESFENDPRTACKYGEKCYQRNPQHHKRFKHPTSKRKVPKAEEEEKSDGEEEVTTLQYRQEDVGEEEEGTCLRTGLT